MPKQQCRGRAALGHREAPRTPTLAARCARPRDGMENIRGNDFIEILPLLQSLLLWQLLCAGLAARGCVVSRAGA